MSATATSERARAAAAADSACPRCGAHREPDQRYCLGCGLPLPVVSGRLPALRRRWIARLGWYPGDWVWASLGALAVAAAAAAGAIVVSEHRGDARPGFASVVQRVAVREPATPVPTTTRPRSSTDTSTLPKPPEPTPAAAARVTWPVNENGWTIVLVSYPKTYGHDEAVATAKRAAKSGLNQVGVIDSSGFASLQPGYYVVFTGVYGSKDDADAAVATARQAGFAGAYSRQIAR